MATCDDRHTEEVRAHSSPSEQDSECNILEALSPLIEQFSSKAVSVHEFEQLSCISPFRFAPLPNLHLVY